MTRLTDFETMHHVSHVARRSGSSYDDLVSRFRWDIPDRFNIGVACADRPPENARRPAIIDWSGDGRRR
jgi:hypothetical protein